MKIQKSALLKSANIAEQKLIAENNLLTRFVIVIFCDRDTKYVHNIKSDLTYTAQNIVAMLRQCCNVAATFCVVWASISLKYVVKIMVISNTQ